MSDNHNFESGIDLNDLSWFEKLCQVPPPRLSDISSEEDGEIIDVKVPTQISRQLQRTKEKEARDVIVKERHRMEEEEAGRVNYTIELEASMKNRVFKQRSVQQLPRFQMPRDMWMPKKPWFPHPSGYRPRKNLRAPSPEKYLKCDQAQGGSFPTGPSFVRRNFSSQFAALPPPMPTLPLDVAIQDSPLGAGRVDASAKNETKPRP